MEQPNVTQESERPIVIVQVIISRFLRVRTQGCESLDWKAETPIVVIGRGTAMEEEANDWRPFVTGKWTGAAWISEYRSYCEIDPYFIWADLTNFAFFDSDPKLSPVILELNPDLAPSFFEQARNWPWIKIPSLYFEPTKGVESSRFCTAMLSPEALNNLAELSKFVKRFALGLPLATDAEPESGADPESSGSEQLDGKPGPKVVVAVIDDGLAPAHERFRGWHGDVSSSRVRWCWNQDGPDEVPPGKAGFVYGREISKQQIDDAVRRSTHVGLIDEDEVYRRLGYGHCSRYATHGAHVMDLACGEDPREGSDVLPDIVCVQLPRRTTADTSGASLGVHVLNGLRYILSRADRLAEAPPPVVVNLSYGNFAGPHDGSSILEQAIDELIELRQEVARFAVVLPAGNGRLSRCHGRSAELVQDATAEFAWRVLPDDATPSFLEIWAASKDEGVKMAIQVWTPWGNLSPWIDEGRVESWYLGDDPVCTVVNLGHVATGDRKMVLVCVAPTTTFHPTANVAPAGVWQIRVKNAASEPLVVDAWIQRDDTVQGFRPRGRQSCFEDPCYERFDDAGRVVEEDNASYIKRDGTLNAIASGEKTVVVGGYRESDGSVAIYSSGGDDTGRVRPPDALAVSERSPARPGVLAAGARSGGAKLALTGTSVAAPQVTRMIAEWMLAGEYPEPRVADQARIEDPGPEGKPKEPAPGDRAPKPPPKRGGGGRLKSRLDQEHESNPSGA
jgi:hypothetical protein